MALGCRKIIINIGRRTNIGEHPTDLVGFLLDASGLPPTKERRRGPLAVPGKKCHEPLLLKDLSASMSDRISQTLFQKGINKLEYITPSLSSQASIPNKSNKI